MRRVAIFFQIGFTLNSSIIDLANLTREKAGTRVLDICSG